MNKDNIKQFIKAFMDFRKHAEVELMHHNAKQAYLDYELRKQESVIISDSCSGVFTDSTILPIESEIEQQAAELEVTVDYYMAEFM